MNSRKRTREKKGKKVMWRMGQMTGAAQEAQEAAAENDWALRKTTEPGHNTVWKQPRPQQSRRASKGQENPNERDDMRHKLVSTQFNQLRGFERYRT